MQIAMNSTLSQSQEQENPSMKEQKLRIIDWFPGVLIHPVKLFRGIDRRGPKLEDWMLPVLALVFLSLIVSGLDLVSESFASIRNSMDDTASIALHRYTLEFDGANKALSTALTLLSSPVVLVITIMAGAAVIWIIGLIAAPKKLSFKACLSIAGVHQLVAFIAAVLMLIIIPIRGSACSFRIDRIFQIDPENALLAFLAGIQLFTIFKFVIVMIGLYVFGRMTKTRAMLTALAVLIVIVTIGLTVLPATLVKYM
jgi:Yip1 domain